MKTYPFIRNSIVVLLAWLILSGWAVSHTAAASVEFQLIGSLGKQEGGALGKLIKDASGNFYGTTGYGGLGFGTVFKIDASGNFSVVHEFDGEIGGAYPNPGVILGSDGDLYGTTSNGSSSNYGAVFKLDPAGNFTVLHEFTNGSPRDELIQASDGNFYGTINSGGANSAGIVFKVEPSGNFSVLHEFDGAGGGANPEAGLIQASDGSFYGTTYNGGSNGYGTVFKIDLSGNFSVVHDFEGGAAGANPGSLILGNDGSFYGTTYGSYYGDFYGTVFKLDASGNFSVLHDFEGGAAGANPGRLVLGSDSNFYGVATGGIYDYGLLFKIDTSENFTVLYSFDGGINGANPAGLIEGNNGSFYGTTYQGGSNGSGTVFKLDESGNVTVLHEFALNNAASPISLVQGSDGSFYGIGSGNSAAGGLGGGTVFKLDDASGQVNLLYAFDSSNGGIYYPNPELIEARDGEFYGTAAFGGSSGGGAVFKLDLSGTLTILHSFDPDSSEGYSPTTLILGKDGHFYGITSGGGSQSAGTVFRLDETGKVDVLHVFSGGNYDAYVVPSKLIQADDGNLYGTQGGGGSQSAGTVFRLDKAGNFKILYSFDGASGGAYRPNGLIQGNDGNLYGTTTAGFIDYGTYLYGKLFKIDAAGDFSVLHTFTESVNNSTPNGNLIQASDGSLYGTTTGGGSDLGTAFKLDPSGNLTVLHSFDEETGSEPTFGLIQAKDGSFYGTTYSGGPYWGGTIYRLIETPDAAPIVLESSANPSLRGQRVTFTATVTGNSPTGSVRFLKGTRSLGSAPLIGGVARLSMSRLKIGSHSVTAVYSGDANHASVTSAPLVQVVKAATKKEPRARPRGNWGRGNR